MKLNRKTWTNPGSKHTPEDAARYSTSQYLCFKNNIALSVGRPSLNKLIIFSNETDLPGKVQVKVKKKY